MPLRPKSILPSVLQQLFEKYAYLGDLNLQTEAEILTHCHNFFLELSQMFGEELLEDALELLTESKINIYSTERHYRTVAEIDCKWPKSVNKLLPNVNFCWCHDFKTKVLGLELMAEQQESTNYTCKHVLALRLAQLLKTKNLQQIKWNKQKYDFVLRHTLPH